MSDLARLPSHVVWPATCLPTPAGQPRPGTAHARTDIAVTGGGGGGGGGGAGQCTAAGRQAPADPVSPPPAPAPPLGY